MKFVREQKNKSKVCKLLGVNRSNVYYQSKRKPDELENLVIQIFKEHNATYGCPRIKKALQKQGIQASKRRIGKILKQAGLEAKHGRRKLARNVYTAPDERYIAENLIKGMKNEKANTVWQMDYTEMKYRGGKLYVNGIIDTHDKVVVISSSERATKEMSKECMQKAVEKYGKPQIIHTDRGSIYTSTVMKDLMEELTIQRSMSAPGSPNENQYIESFWKTLKTEIGRTQELTKQELQMVLSYYENYYNTKRMHSSIDYYSPEEKRALLKMQYEKEGEMAFM